MMHTFLNYSVITYDLRLFKKSGLGHQCSVITYDLGFTKLYNLGHQKLIRDILSRIWTWLFVHAVEINARKITCALSSVERFALYLNGRLCLKHDRKQRGGKCLEK